MANVAMKSCAVFVSLALGAVSLGVSSAAAAESADKALPAAKQRPAREELRSWRRAIQNVPRPKHACYEATYPETKWREVPCKMPPHKLYPPRTGGMSQAETVGHNSGDFTAVTPGLVSKARGSFDPGTIVSSECSVPCPGPDLACPADPVCTPTSSTNNVYSLQLNTNPFNTSACNDSPNTSDVFPCQGWAQFIYPSSGKGFIQYWLLNYGPSGTMCPAQSKNCAKGIPQTDGWCPVSLWGNGYCVVNGPSNSAPASPITSLTDLEVVGLAGADGNEMIVYVDETAYMTDGGGYLPDLGNPPPGGSGWQQAEFNVFGDGNGDQAVFSPGSTVVVRLAVDSAPPSGVLGCLLQSFTGETNNLTLANTPPSFVDGGDLPALVFSETFPAPAGMAATCADATPTPPPPPACTSIPVGSSSKFNGFLVSCHVQCPLSQCDGVYYPDPLFNLLGILTQPCLACGYEVLLGGEALTNWTAEVVKANGAPVAQEVLRENANIVLRLKPSPDDIRSGAIAGYKLKLIAKKGANVKQASRLHAGLRVSMETKPSGK